MKKTCTCGLASIAFEDPVFVESCASVVGKKEGEGPLGEYFDRIFREPMMGEDTWEAAESALQKEAAVMAIEKAGLTPQDIRMLFAGDLLAQTTATAFGTAGIEVPFYGLYGACSTMGESLSLSAMAAAGGYGNHILCATSSHFASAEKEFRFPLGYGSQRPLSASWTVTGAGACVVGNVPPSPENGGSVLRKGRSCVAVTGVTTGKLVDFGLKDSMNMGGCMAPAACDTIVQNFFDFGRTPEDYDVIFTGDLGSVGQKILFDLLGERNFDIRKQHQDCGMMIYDPEAQDTHSGGSGCGCAASVLSGYILPNLLSHKWDRILFVPTGALLSKVSFNEGDTVPGIAHAVVLEYREV